MNFIAGTFLQGQHGKTLEQAIEHAKGTWEANDQHNTIAVVEGTNFPQYSLIISQKPLFLIEGTDNIFPYTHDGRVIDTHSGI